MMGSKIEAMQGARKKENKHRKGRKILCVLCVMDEEGFLFKITQWAFVIFPPKEVRPQWFSNKQIDLTSLLKTQILGFHPWSF